MVLSYQMSTDIIILIINEYDFWEKEATFSLIIYLIYLFVYIFPQPRAEILKLYHASESPGGLLKQILLGPTPRISDSVGWGRSCELASLTS